MPKSDNHIQDAPENWERYGELLRSRPAPSMASDRVAGIASRLDAAIESRARRNRTIRFIAAPAVALCTLAVILAVTVPWLRDNQAAAPAVTAARVSSAERPRANRRPLHQQLPAPQVSETTVVPDPSLAELQPRIQADSVHVNHVPEPGPGIASRSIPSASVPLP